MTKRIHSERFIIEVLFSSVLLPHRVCKSGTKANIHNFKHYIQKSVSKIVQIKIIYCSQSRFPALLNLSLYKVYFVDHVLT